MDDVPLPTNTFQVEPDDGAEAQLVLAMSAYGVYTEKIVIRQPSWAGATAREGSLQRLQNKFKATRMTRPGTTAPALAMMTTPQDQEADEPPHAIQRDKGDSWCLTSGSPEAQRWVPLTEKGCLWRASKQARQRALQWQIPFPNRVLPQV